jgi:hypothetical protein
MLLAQSGKPPVHDRLGRAFQDDAVTAVHRNAARDGRSKNPPLHAGHTRQSGRGDKTIAFSD